MISDACLGSDLAVHPRGTPRRLARFLRVLRERFHTRSVVSIANLCIGRMLRMFGRFKIERQRRAIIRQDRQYLEARARHFLEGFLLASDLDKDRYFGVVAAVAAACQPDNVVSFSENLQVAEITAATASAVVMRRILIEQDRPGDRAYAFMTDACATAAVAFRRAAGVYVGNKKMQRLGTAAVHLLTMATSREMANSKMENKSPEGSSAECPAQALL